MREALLAFGLLRLSPRLADAHPWSPAPSGLGWPASWPRSAHVGPAGRLFLAAPQSVGPRFAGAHLRQTLQFLWPLRSSPLLQGAHLTGPLSSASQLMRRGLDQSPRPWRRGL